MNMKITGTLSSRTRVPSSPALPEIQERKEAEKVAIKTRSATQSLEEKLLSFLGRGNCSNEDAAAACGISVSRVSQIITEPEFAARLAEEKFKHASAYQERDLSWDSLEDKLLEKAHQMLPMITKPSEVIAMARMANTATRRATSGVNNTSAPKTVVNLFLPNAAMARFVTNGMNQVVQAGSQSLITVQAERLATMASTQAQGEIHDGTLERLPAPETPAG